MSVCILVKCEFGEQAFGVGCEAGTCVALVVAIVFEWR